MFIDFFNLYKTRLIIRLIDRGKTPVFLFLIFIALDVVLSFVLFVASYSYLDALNMAHQYSEAARYSIWRELALSVWFVGMIVADASYWIDKLAMLLLGPTSNELAVFFFAGLLPTLWLLLYVMATAVARGLIRFAGLISFTVNWLDVDKPFELIGFVAALLVCIFIAMHAAIAYLLSPLFPG